MTPIPSSRIIVKMPSWWSGNSFDKWWFANEAALLVAYPNWIASPTSRNGWKATNGQTDTIWVWDADTNAWVNSGVAASAWLLPTIASTISSLQSLANLWQVVPWQKYKADVSSKWLDPNDNSLFVGTPETLTFTGKTTTSFEPIVSSDQFPDDILTYDITPVALTLASTAQVAWDSWIELYALYSKTISLTPTATWFDFVLPHSLDMDSYSAFSIFNNVSNETWAISDTPNNINIAYPWVITDNGWNSYSFDMTAIPSIPWAVTYSYTGVENVSFYIACTSFAGYSEGKFTYRKDPVQNNQITVGNILNDPTDSADFRSANFARWFFDPTADYPWLSTWYWSWIPNTLMNECITSYGWTVNKSVLVDSMDKTYAPMFAFYSGIYQFRSESGVRTLNMTSNDVVYWFTFEWVSSEQFIHFDSSVFGCYVWPNCELWGLFLWTLSSIDLRSESTLKAPFHACDYNGAYLRNATFENNVTDQITIRRMKLYDTFVWTLDIKSTLSVFKVSWGSIQNMQLQCVNAEINNLTFELANNVYFNNANFIAQDELSNIKLHLGWESFWVIGNVAFDCSTLRVVDLRCITSFWNILARWYISRWFGWNEWVFSFVQDAWAVMTNTELKNASMSWFTNNWIMFSTEVWFTLSGTNNWFFNGSRFNAWFNATNNWTVWDVVATVYVEAITITWSYVWWQTRNGKSPDWSIRYPAYDNLWVLNPTKVV